GARSGRPRAVQRGAGADAHALTPRLRLAHALLQDGRGLRRVPQRPPVALQDGRRPGECALRAASGRAVRADGPRGLAARSRSRRCSHAARARGGRRRVRWRLRRAKSRSDRHHPARWIGLVTALALTICASLGETQEPKSHPSKIPVVGILHPGLPDPTFPSVAALRQGLAALGYVEGQNIRLEYRWAEGKVEQLPSLAASLVRLNVDALYTRGPLAMRAARGATRTVPSVGYTLEGDRVESGFVASIARAGGNVTGLFLKLPDLTGKWLELIKEVVPAPRRIPVLWDATTSPLQLRAINR